MLLGKRSGVDRRTGMDRRKEYNLEYLLEGGIERRRWRERRSKIERRAGWVRISEWVSAPMEELKT